MSHDYVTKAVGSLHGMLYLERTDLNWGTTDGGEVLEDFKNVTAYDGRDEHADTGCLSFEMRMK